MTSLQLFPSFLVVPRLHRQPPPRDRYYAPAGQAAQMSALANGDGVSSHHGTRSSPGAAAPRNADTPAVLKLRHASTPAEVRAALAAMHGQEAALKGRLESLLSSQADLTRELGRLDHLRPGWAPRSSPPARWPTTCCPARRRRPAASATRSRSWTWRRAASRTRSAWWSRWPSSRLASTAWSGPWARRRTGRRPPATWRAPPRCPTPSCAAASRPA